MEASASSTTRFSDVLEPMFEKRADLRVNFQKCTIDISSLIDSNGGLARGDDFMLPLSFLRDLRLRVHGQDFLPDTIYVRPEMQEMFSCLTKPYGETLAQQILIGSPGIGKSVLFFLAALFRAFNFSEIRPIYFRKTDDELSVFVMEKAQGAGMAVNVLFSRMLNINRITNISDLSVDLEESQEVADYTDFFFMLDGPHHNSKKTDLLRYQFSALCTSGGWPPLKQEQYLSVKILVLSAWTETAILAALARNGVLAADAENIYELSGGRIRLALLAMSSPDRVEQYLDFLIKKVTTATVDLATDPGTEISANSSDWLRSCFFNSGTRKFSMLVDSRYIFHKLINGQGCTKLLEAYQLARAYGLQSARGWFYEEIFHQWFKTMSANQPSPFRISGWMRSSGTGAEGVAEFVNKRIADGQGGFYWIPSIPNFACIDAAILFDAVLVCLQYTVGGTHRFNFEKLWEDFVGVLIQSGVPISSVHVWFLYPSDIKFISSFVDFDHKHAPPGQVSTRSGGLQTTEVRFADFSMEAENLDMKMQDLPFPR